jgi:hypothetical protein
LFTYPQLAQKARLYFVDKPIHKESTNFIPYNLSSAIHEKEKYPSLRRALATLAHQTKSPSAEQVQKAIAPLGVTFTPLSFLEITQGMAEYESRIMEFNVRSTSTVIFRNTRNGKIRTLSATNQITAPNLLKTIEDVDGSLALNIRKSPVKSRKGSSGGMGT